MTTGSVRLNEPSAGGLRDLPGYFAGPRRGLDH